jgi:hypothetical protein
MQCFLQLFCFVLAVEAQNVLCSPQEHDSAIPFSLCAQDVAHSVRYSVEQRACLLPLATLAQEVH